MQHSPLHDRHVSLGAKFLDFGGWSMPVQYSGVVAEHQAIRSTAGLFDVSHLGKVSVTGSGVVDFLNHLLSNDLRKIGFGQAQYTMLCNPAGGVIDDLIAYLVSPGEALLVPNAANSGAVVAALAEAAPPTIQVTDRHLDFAILAVQGPAAKSVMETLELPASLDYMSFVRAGDGEGISVCRTGYTGELGFELIIPADRSVALWDRLLRAGAGLGLLPAGLGARDTLRTEMGYALHGHEITPEIDPVSAGLSWAVGWSKASFIGSARLREIRAAGPTQRARGLKAIGRGIPRPGMSIQDQAGSGVGVVTSGTFSPTLKQGIGLGLVAAEIELGDRVEVMIRDRLEPFEVVRPPFVASAVR